MLSVPYRRSTPLSIQPLNISLLLNSELLIYQFPSAIRDQASDHPHPHIPNYYVQMWKLNSEDGGKEKQLIHFIYGVGGELSTDTLDLQKDKLEGPRVN